MNTPLPAPAQRCGTIHTPARAPRLVQFDLQLIAIEVPSRTTSRVYRVVAQFGHAPKCPCRATKDCHHLHTFTEHLFSESGLWETLELLSPQIPDSAPHENSPAYYEYRSLVALKDEIEARLGLDIAGTAEEWDGPAQPPISFCRCGAHIEGVGHEAYCNRCQGFVADVLKRPLPIQMEEWDDLNPFEDLQPVVVGAAPVRDFNYYAAYFQGVTQ